LDDVREVIEQFRDSLDTQVADNIHGQAQMLVSHWSTRLRKKDPRNPELKDLHATRICVKRLRYAAELLRDIEGRDQDALIAALADMQESLGRWNDHLAAAAQIVEVAGTAELLAARPGWASKMMHYAALRANLAETLRAEIVGHWSSIEPILRADPAIDTEGPTPVVREEQASPIEGPP